jgi:hypothetical protein
MINKKNKLYFKMKKDKKYKEKYDVVWATGFMWVDVVK